MTTITSVRKWFLARPLWTNEDIIYGCFNTEQDARDACCGKDGAVVFYIDIPIPKEVNDYIKDRCEKILAD